MTNQTIKRLFLHHYDSQQAADERCRLIEDFLSGDYMQTEAASSLRSLNVYRSEEDSRFVAETWVFETAEAEAAVRKAAQSAGLLLKETSWLDGHDAVKQMMAVIWRE